MIKILTLIIEINNYYNSLSDYKIIYKAICQANINNLYKIIILCQYYKTLTNKITLFYLL